VSGDAELRACVADHARRILDRDLRAREDLVPDAHIEPPDLLDRLLDARFQDFELVAHARVGAHHIVKTRYLGPRAMVVQARWVRDAEGRWRIHEAEIARVASERPRSP
jgi:hypothetical protein